jgi:hypothetical protein
MRDRGTFFVVQYESPEEDAALLPYGHIDGYTEFSCRCGSADECY